MGRAACLRMRMEGETSLPRVGGGGPFVLLAPGFAPHSRGGRAVGGSSHPGRPALVQQGQVLQARRFANHILHLQGGRRTKQCLVKTGHRQLCATILGSLR
ncbi:unnamed protein product [Ixodes pacificus]